MSVSLHTAATATFLTVLQNLTHVLQKGEASALERKIDPQIFVQGRLAPDMLPLARQVMIATDNAKGAAYRLAGLDVPKMEDNETTFAELQARIAKTIDLIKAVPGASFEGREGATIELPQRSGVRTFAALDYLFGYALPNFQFHAVMTYAILRHLGVPIGKSDYFGQV